MTQLEGDIRLLAFGDSFVNGVCDPEGLGWLGRVMAHQRQAQPDLDLTFYNLGIRRDTSRDILKRWSQEYDARHFAGAEHRLVFGFGVNDACPDQTGQCSRLAMAESLANFEAILGQAQQLAPTLFIGPAPVAIPGVNNRLGPLDQAFQQRAEAMGLPYLSVYAPLSASALWGREVAARDDAHPGAAGYALLADLIGASALWQQLFNPNAA